ncbi:hypothetical protein BHYA_0149g00160 [Botrytis hyacinthi]|uniref:Uncharacterized protein n=1 Tax=Botrytis hyacinthi TaxID=278943 RepID=A0A4Z1GPK0_9HELO|nr:hypothetical protein BHYA_0149g00160 [Botrytis hyacinthi]
MPICLLHKSKRTESDQLEHDPGREEEEEEAEEAEEANGTSFPPALFFLFASYMYSTVQLLFSQSKVSLSPLPHLGLWPQIYNSPTFPKRTFYSHLSSNRIPQSAIKPSPSPAKPQLGSFPSTPESGSIALHRTAPHRTTLTNPIAQQHLSIPSLARPNSPPSTPATDPHPLIHPSTSTTQPSRTSRNDDPPTWKTHIISYQTSL